jgi:amidase
MSELCDLGAVEIARRVRAGGVGAAAVLEAHLARIARDNPQVNAVVTLAVEQAMDQARSIDARVRRGEAVGLLAGVPVGVKDVTPTAGIRTTYGSPLYADNVPNEDAEVVKRLRAADAVIVGKTNTPEFAAGANTVNKVFGATRNPWDLSRSVGGSTGGGAAAVASGMIAIAEGTDFGGSLRVPAAFCGVVGLRTTAGLIPSHPVPQPWDGGRVHGPIARSAEDCALMLDAAKGLSGVSPISAEPPWASAAAIVASSTDLRGLRVGYVEDLAGIGVEPDVARLCRSAAELLAGAGATVEPIALDLSDGFGAYQTLRGEWMAAQYFEHLERIDTFGANLAGNVRQGLAVSARDIAAAEAKRADCWHRVRVAFQRYDVLATPAAPITPFPVEQNYPAELNGKKLGSYIDWIAPTFLITLVGLPAASVPAGLASNGLPVGLQIVGPRFGEPRILSVAKHVQRLRPLPLPRFPIDR